MATAVFFHAHPDDESIATAGVMLRAAEAGHRVVLVTATDGSLGESAPGSVPEGSTLAEVRAEEVRRAAEVLGVHRVELLGYRDSGMEGEPSNDDPESFWRTDVEVAAQRLAAILREERTDLLTTYDAHGNYGHPDHIQVHRVGVRAAELAGVRAVFEATMNRDAMREMAEHDDFGGIAEAEDLIELEERRQEMAETDMGTPASEITHAVDVSDLIDRKKQAMAEHASQITPDSWFMQMPDEVFAAAFGTEWFVQRGASRVGEPFAGNLFEALG